MLTLDNALLSNYGLRVLTVQEGGERVLVEHSDGTGRPVWITIEHAQAWAENKEG